VCGGGKASQRFEVFEKRCGWVCAVCPGRRRRHPPGRAVEGCDFRAAIERLGGARARSMRRAQKLAAERDAKRLAREAETAKYREAERKRLWKIWDGGRRHRRHVAERAICRAAAWSCRGLPGPALPRGAPISTASEVDDVGRKSARRAVARAGHAGRLHPPDRHFGGLHMTWLVDADPPRKLELADPATGEVLPAKKMRGSKTGAFILVAKAETPSRGG
jgi:hypothetical protein